MNLRCLIIDDEVLAREMLAAYASRIEGLVVIASCKHAVEAQRWLQRTEIDLLLLDIHMPQMTGIDLIRDLINPPLVIFTTAFSSYALEGYELSVVDYLLKPIGFERFQQAITKAQQRKEHIQKAHAYERIESFEAQYVIIKEGYDRHKVFWKDIRYIKAMQEYSSYCTVHGKIMELKTLAQVAKRLPVKHFMRVHRSYIVARACVQKHTHNSLILTDGTSIPIGKTYRQQVLKAFFGVG